MKNCIIAAIVTFASLHSTAQITLTTKIKNNVIEAGTSIKPFIGIKNEGNTPVTISWSVDAVSTRIPSAMFDVPFICVIPGSCYTYSNTQSFTEVIPANTTAFVEPEILAKANAIKDSTCSVGINVTVPGVVLPLSMLFNVTVVKYPTSIVDQALTDFNIFPNPSKNYFLINNAKNVNQILLVNSFGAIVRTESTFQNDIMEVNTSNITSGYYNVIIENKDKKVITKRIVVQN
jgi:Secretion system C-terminal sorting domain